jgi:hypothetical protein
MEDVRSTTSTQDRAQGAYANKAYEGDGSEKKSYRSESFRREKERGYQNEAYDDADSSQMRGGHDSRRDQKYDKKRGYSRNEEYAMTKVSRQPNGILKSRSKSEDHSQSSTEGSTFDANALVHGYSATKHDHPNIHRVPKDLAPSSRSRSRSRGRSGSRGPPSSTSGRSRTGSFGKGSMGKKGAAPPKSDRQYNDLSIFLAGDDRSRPRSRSAGSLGRSSRPRSDSRHSDTTPSEVSFTPSGASSKNTRGRRVQIQGVEEEV